VKHKLQQKLNFVKLLTTVRYRYIVITQLFYYILYLRNDNNDTVVTAKFYFFCNFFLVLAQIHKYFRDKTLEDAIIQMATSK